MGCSINFHIEAKINNKWEHYANPSVERNYRLFGLLAGVRNDSVKPISLPKGLPEDISVITKMDFEITKDNGIHSMTWLNAEEIYQLSETLALWTKEEDVPLPGYDLECAILKTYFFSNSFAGSLPNGVEDVRFVFWFDN